MASVKKSFKLWGIVALFLPILICLGAEPAEAQWRQIFSISEDNGGDGGDEGNGEGVLSISASPAGGIQRVPGTCSPGPAETVCTIILDPVTKVSSNFTNIQEPVRTVWIKGNNNEVGIGCGESFNCPIAAASQTQCLQVATAAIQFNRPLKIYAQFNNQMDGANSLKEKIVNGDRPHFSIGKEGLLQFNCFLEER